MYIYVFFLMYIDIYIYKDKYVPKYLKSKNIYIYICVCVRPTYIQNSKNLYACKCIQNATLNR